MKKETELKQAVTAAEPVEQAAAPKAEAKKPAKPAAKKPAAPRRKAAAKTSQEVYVQFGGGQWSVADLVEQAKAAYAAQGHDLADAKKVCVYVKPEEGKAYYVVNDVDTGSVAL